MTSINEYSGFQSIPADAPLRVARPVADLAVSERFWVDGVGLSVLWRTPPREASPDVHEPEHALLMVGIPGASWHLELVEDPVSAAVAVPSAEDLLVIYLGGAPDETWLAELVSAGGQVVAARNPYWDRWGTTILDPDGYRLVLSTRDWASSRL